MDDLFRASRLKTGRGRRHIAGLVELMEAVREQHDEFHVVMSFSSPSGFLPESTFPEFVIDGAALFVGDAVHNLRSALDLLACEVVERSRKSPHHVHFPFSETRAGLTGQTAGSPPGGEMQRKRFYRARQDAQDTLLALEPHGEPGGNRLLWGLHRLDLVDKHQDLLSLEGHQPTPAIYVEGVLMKPDNHEPQRLVFARDAGHFPGECVMTTLNLIAAEVEATIERFASLGW